MATEINCSCEITENEVTICYPPISSGGGGGIGGGGTVNTLAKFTPDGVTIGDSDIYDGVGGFWQKTASGGGDINISFTDSDNWDYAALGLSVGAGTNLNWANTTTNVIQNIQNGENGIMLSVLDKTTSNTYARLVLGSSEIYLEGVNIPLGTAGKIAINSSGYLYTDTSGGGGGTTTNPLTIGSGLSGTSFDGSAAVTIQNQLITGLAGGQTIVSGTAATDKLIIKITTGNQTTGASNLVSIKSGNNGANELIRIGDGIGSNIGELSIWAAGQSSSSTHLLRAGTNFTYINAGTDLRLQVGAVNYINMLSGAGTVAIQKPVTFATGANVTLVAGSTTVAPLVFTSGTNKTTPTNGSMEYNGTNFFATRAGAVRENIVCASAVNTVSPTSPDRTITVNINGTTFYIAAKTTND